MNWPRYLETPRGVRRVVSLLFILLGGLLMLLAPETWSGVLFLIFGVVIEVIGIAVFRR